MTTLSHDEFDNADNSGNALRPEEHDHVVTVNDSGFLGKDEIYEEEVVPVDDTIDDVDTLPSTTEGSAAVDNEVQEFDTPFVPAVESSADLDSGEETPDPNQPVPEALGEHREGESIGEWLRNDWEQTKQDLHLGN